MVCQIQTLYEVIIMFQLTAFYLLVGMQGGDQEERMEEPQWKDKEKGKVSPLEKEKECFSVEG